MENNYNVAVRTKSMQLLWSWQANLHLWVINNFIQYGNDFTILAQASLLRPGKLFLDEAATYLNSDWIRQYSSVCHRWAVFSDSTQISKGKDS